MTSCGTVRTYVAPQFQPCVKTGGCPCKRDSSFKFTRRCCPKDAVDTPINGMDVFLPKETCSEQANAIADALENIPIQGTTNFDLASKGGTGKGIPVPGLSVTDCNIIDNDKLYMEDQTGSGSRVLMEMIVVGGGCNIRIRSDSTNDAVDLDQAGNGPITLFVTRVNEPGVKNPGQSCTVDFVFQLV